MSDRNEFGILLYNLSERLTDEEISGIILIEELPANLKGKRLDVLVHLQVLEKISAAEPAKLQQVFKNINRMDLVSKVKDFIKSQKKKEKKTTKSKSLGDSTEKMVHLDASLKVSLIQTQVLRDQLINVAAAADKCGEAKITKMIQESIRALHKEVERTVITSQQVLECSKDSCSSSGSCGDDDTSPESSLTRYECPSTFQQKFTKELQQVQAGISYPTQEESRYFQDERVYEEIQNTSRIPFHPEASSLTDDGQYYAMADLPPSSMTVTSTPKNTLPGALNRPKKPIIQNDRSSLRSSYKDMNKPIPIPKKLNPQVTDENDLDCSTGGDCSYTGSGSDSGFSESWKYLKRPIALPRYSGKTKKPETASRIPRPVPPPRPSSRASTGYTALNTEQVKLSYYKSSRDNTQKFHDLMSEKSSGTVMEEQEEESMYQNIRSS